MKGVAGVKAGRRAGQRPRIFEIKMVAAKSFYVKARSREQALDSDIVGEEESVDGCQLVDWEHIETEVMEVGPQQAKFLLKHPNPRKIYSA